MQTPIDSACYFDAAADLGGLSLTPLTAQGEHIAGQDVPSGPALNAISSLQGEFGLARVRAQEFE